MENKKTHIEDINRSIYDIKDQDNSSYKSEKGRTPEIIKEISRKKEEPEWMLDFRLKSLEIYNNKPMPEWAVDLSDLDLDEITTYIKPDSKQSHSWEDVPEDIKTQMPKLYVSGCPSSCGQHLRGEIGFSGKMKRIDGESVSVYAIYFGGKVGEDAKLATRYGDIIAEEIPRFLYELALLKRNNGYSNFERFFDKSHEQILDLVDKYDVSNMSLKKREY